MMKTTKLIFSEVAVERPTQGVPIPFRPKRSRGINASVMRSCGIVSILKSTLEWCAKFPILMLIFIVQWNGVFVVAQENSSPELREMVDKVAHLGTQNMQALYDAVYSDPDAQRLKATAEQIAKERRSGQLAWILRDFPVESVPWQVIARVIEQQPSNLPSSEKELSQAIEVFRATIRSGDHWLTSYEMPRDLLDPFKLRNRICRKLLFSVNGRATDLTESKLLSTNPSLWLEKAIKGDLEKPSDVIHPHQAKQVEIEIYHPQKQKIADEPLPEQQSRSEIPSAKSTVSRGTQPIKTIPNSKPNTDGSNQISVLPRTESGLFRWLALAAIIVATLGLIWMRTKHKK